MIKDLANNLNLGENIEISTDAEKMLLAWEQINPPCKGCDILEPDNAPNYHLSTKISKAFKDWKHLDTWMKTHIDMHKHTKSITDYTSNISTIHEDVLTETIEKPNDEPKIKFAVWGHQKNYSDNELIIKLINVNDGIRVRVVDKHGKNLPNGALFFLRNKIILYENINPNLGLTLVQSNRLYA